MTAAFQGNAFQPNAFQMGSDGAPAPSDQNSLISDGNETVQILHEQGLNTDHLGTVSEYQPPELCQAPAVRSVSSYTSDGATATSHNIPLPSGYQAGDRLWGVIISFTSASEISIPAGWNTSTGTGVGIIPSFALWRDADGTEGANLTVNLSPAGSLYGFFYAIKAGTFDPYVAPFAGAALQQTTTTPDPPSTATTFGEAFSLFVTTCTVVTAARNITAYPSNCSDWPTSVLIPSTSGTAIASSSVQALAASYDPTNFTINASGTVVTRVHAIKGSCFPAEPLKNHILLDEQDFTDRADYGSTSEPLSDDFVAPQDQIFNDGLDTQDFTDTSEYGWVISPPDDADEECLFPVVTSVTAGSNLVTGTSHVVTLPTLSVGDLALVIFGDNGNTHTATAGWTETVDNESFVVYSRIIDGTEGGSMTITSSATTESVWYVVRIKAGTFDPTSAIPSAVTLNGNRTPPLLNFGWSDKTLVFAGVAGDTATSPITFGYPANMTDNEYGQETGGVTAPDAYITFATAIVDGSTFSPGAFTLTNQGASNHDTATFAVRGNCRKQQSIIALDDQDFTDRADYSSETEPLSEDAVVLEDPLLGDGEGLDTQDFTDLSEYGFVVYQPIADNNPEVCVEAIALDEQDFTDLSDYGFSTAPAIPDNNPEVAPSTLDEQDFTDFADYGFSSDPLADDFVLREDFILGIALDDQDFTDRADYGVTVDQPIADNNPEVAPSALDEQDFTDLSDYGFSVDPLAENFTLREDFILGDGQGLDTQDFTDLSDYRYSVDQLSTNHEDFILGIALDDQDFTDRTDYSFTVDQLSTDHVDFILGIALDDQDRTDLADYGSTTEQAIPDNDQNFRPDMVALDDQDRTDFTDYGFSVDPLSDNLRQDFALGDGQGLDSQDFTDFTDYGSYTAPLSDDTVTPENFILGTGQGLDDQDRTDFTDYGYQYYPIPDNVTVVTVNGVDITVQVGCFHVYGFGAITDPSTVWTPASTASTTWAQVADPGSPVWTAVPNGSTTWSGVTDPSDPGWEEDC